MTWEKEGSEQEDKLKIVYKKDIITTKSKSYTLEHLYSEKANHEAEKARIQLRIDKVQKYIDEIEAIQASEI